MQQTIPDVQNKIHELIALDRVNRNCIDGQAATIKTLEYQIAELRMELDCSKNRVCNEIKHLNMLLNDAERELSEALDALNVEKMSMKVTIELMEEHGLMVRPSLGGQWRAGKWQGVTGDGRAYCSSEAEASTIEQAVLCAVAKLTPNGVANSAALQRSPMEAEGRSES